MTMTPTTDITNMNPNPNNDSDNTLRNDIRSLLHSIELHDLTLHPTTGPPIPAVRAILGARSPVFRRMLYGDFYENRHGEIRLEYSQEVVRLLVDFCFTDELAVGGENVEEVRLLTALSSAANYLDVPKLDRDVRCILEEKMGLFPSLACVVLDEASTIMREDICTVALERIRARPRAALLGEVGGVVEFGSCLLERVVFDELSCASEWTKFRCLKRWVEGCREDAVDDEFSSNEEDGIVRSKTSDSFEHEDTKTGEENSVQRKRAVARRLARKIDLSLIPASDLDTVSDSGLLETQDLFRAYRLQALNAERTKSKVFVEGAGLVEVNGTYIQGGVHEGIPMYSKEGVWKDREEVFRIFLCTYSNGNRSWCISIVPTGKEPGKTTDVDFYECPVTYGGKGTGVTFGSAGAEHGSGVVPSRGWKLVNFGQPPAPKCSLISGCFEDA